MRKDDRPRFFGGLPGDAIDKIVVEAEGGWSEGVVDDSALGKSVCLARSSI